MLFLTVQAKSTNWGSELFQLPTFKMVKYKYDVLLVFFVLCVISKYAKTKTFTAPVGSTGCSMEYSEGKCWRFCSGSSGDWCFTSNETESCKWWQTKCAFKTKCSGYLYGSSDNYCVKKCAKVNPQIVGGEEVPNDEFRFMVAIQMNNSVLRCAGILIREDIVLTLASCVENFDRTDRKYWALAGTHDLFNSDDSQELIVDDYIRHPESNLNNICLLKLKTEVVLTKTVEILTLPKDIPEGTNFDSGEVAGWGSEDIRGSWNNIPPLQKVQTTFLANNICKESFPQYDATRRFCAGGDEKGPCFFDDGCPLLVGPERDIFYGIYETGSTGGYFQNLSCAENGTNFRGLYIRLAPLLPWIKEEMKRIPRPVRSKWEGTKPIVIVILTLSVFTSFINCAVFCIVVFQWKMQSSKHVDVWKLSYPIKRIR